MHICNQSTRESEAGGLWVWSQFGQHSKTLSQKSNCLCIQILNSKHLFTREKKSHTKSTSVIHIKKKGQWCKSLSNNPSPSIYGCYVIHAHLPTYVYTQPPHLYTDHIPSHMYTHTYSYICTYLEDHLEFRFVIF
jgi:hypothetical protein